MERQRDIVAVVRGFVERRDLWKEPAIIYFPQIMKADMSDSDSSELDSTPLACLLNVSTAS